MRLARAAQTFNRLQSVGEIYGVETDETAVGIQADNERCETNVDGTPIMKSRVDGRFYSHSSVMFGDSGYSSADTDSSDETTVRHWNHKNQFAGADVYDSNQIRHIDKDNNLLGITPIIIKQTGQSAEAIIADDSYLKAEIEDASRAIRSDHAKDLRDIDSILSAQDKCLKTPSHVNCATLAQQSENALKSLEARFDS